MIFKSHKKLINIISFVLILLSGFYLLFRLYTIFHNPEAGLNQNITYLIILIIILISFVQLILNFILEVEKTIPKVENVIEKTSIPDVKEPVENKDVENEADLKDNSLNNQEILSRVIPGKLSTIAEFGETLLTNLSAEFEIVQGIMHVKNLSENIFSSVSYYAYFSSEKPKDFKEGVTLPGQVAKNKEVLMVDNVPDNYIKVLSGLGEGSPNYLVLIPVVHNEETIAVIEFASFKKYNDNFIALFKNLGNNISVTIYNYLKKSEINKDDKE